MNPTQVYVAHYLEFGMRRPTCGTTRHVRITSRRELVTCKRCLAAMRREKAK